MTLKILNLYAGIGGNRKLWNGDIEVTAIENNPEIAKFAEGGNVSDKLELDPTVDVWDKKNQGIMYKQRREQERRLAEQNAQWKLEDENRAKKREISEKWKKSKALKLGEI